MCSTVCVCVFPSISGDLAVLKGQTFTIKEGCQHRMKIGFRVSVIVKTRVVLVELVVYNVQFAHFICNIMCNPVPNLICGTFTIDIELTQINK